MNGGALAHRNMELRMRSGNGKISLLEWVIIVAFMAGVMYGLVMKPRLLKTQDALLAHSYQQR